MSGLCTTAVKRADLIDNLRGAWRIIAEPHPLKRRPMGFAVVIYREKPMYDCLDLPAGGFRARSTPSVPVSAKATTLELERRFSGRSWVRFSPRGEGGSELARVREIALYLNAQVERLQDGSLIVLGVNIAETLALSSRFGDALAVEAHLGRDPLAS